MCFLWCRRPGSGGGRVAPSSLHRGLGRAAACPEQPRRACWRGLPRAASTCIPGATEICHSIMLPDIVTDHSDTYAGCPCRTYHWCSPGIFCELADVNPVTPFGSEVLGPTGHGSTCGTQLFAPLSRAAILCNRCHSSNCLGHWPLLLPHADPSLPAQLEPVWPWQTAPARVMALSS